MTRYPSWRKHEVRRDGKNILAVFILIVLVFATANGIAKSFSLKKYFSQSEWDSKSPYVSIFSTSPPSIFILQKDPKRLTVFKLDENAYLVTGGKETLKKTADIFAKEDGEKIAEIMSLNLGVDVEKYVTLKEKVPADAESVKNLFKNIASFVAPFKIIGGLNDSEIENTNITRIDLLKLWWQLKGVSVGNVKLVELAPFKEEIVTGDNNKVLGVEEESIRLLMGQYLENRYLDAQKADIEIFNESKVAEAGKLAADFASSAGFNVTRVEQSSAISEATRIIAKDKNSYNASYLASIFDCDIVFQPDEAEQSDLIVIIGRDFASNYFE